VLVASVAYITMVFLLHITGKVVAFSRK